MLHRLERFPQRTGITDIQRASHQSLVDLQFVFEECHSEFVNVDVRTENFEFAHGFSESGAGFVQAGLTLQDVAGDVVNLITKPWSRLFSESFRSRLNFSPCPLRIPELQFQASHEQLRIDGLRLEL